MKIRVFLFLILVPAGTFAGVADAQSQITEKQNDATGTVKMKLLRWESGKPNLKFYYVDLSIANSCSSFQWYLFPYYLSDRLAINGRFNARQNEKHGNIEAGTYPGFVADSQLVRIKFYGHERFLAFCIPPKSTAKFENYMIEAWTDTVISKIECWQVDQLMINGKTKLNKWLPYNVLCSPNVIVKIKDGDYRNWHDPDWIEKEQRVRTDYPNEAVKFIRAKGIKKMQLKIE